MLLAMRTSFDLPNRRVLIVCLYPRTYFPDFMTFASLDMVTIHIKISRMILNVSNLLLLSTRSLGSLTLFCKYLLNIGFPNPFLNLGHRNLCSLIIAAS